MKRSIYTLLLAALTAAVSAGCSRERLPAPGTAAAITVRLEIPGGTEPKSRTMTEDQERYLETVDLLLFERVGTQELYRGRYAVDESGIDNTTNIKSFQVTLPTDAAKEFRLVALANLRDEVLAATLTDGMEKNQLLSGIRFSMAGAWNVPHTPRMLPMWGESTVCHTLAPGAVITTIQLLRSVARIDVIQTDELLLKKFEIRGAAIINHFNTTQAAPDPDKYSHITRTVSDVSLTPGEPITSAPTFYTSYNGMLNGPGHIMREVYVTEYDNLGVTQEQRTKFCIQGCFDGNAAELGWYFVDLTDADGNPYDILRNHLYIVSLTEASGTGAGSPEEAIADPKYAISADVIPWDMNVAVEDNLGEQYKLDISKTHFRFNADGRTGRYDDVTTYLYSTFVPSRLYADHLLSITTDYPDGWYVSRVTDPDGNELTGDERWVTVGRGFTLITDDTGAQTFDPDQPYLEVGANTTANPRSATVHIRAGSLEYEIQVAQDYIDCGRNNIPALVQAYGNDYHTHLYTDPHSQIVRCWMLENLKATADPYNDDEYYLRKDYPGQTTTGERGYYYHIPRFFEGFDPCPDGWQLPSVYEVQAFVSSLTRKGDWVHSVQMDMSDLDELPPELEHIRWAHADHLYAGRVYTGGAYPAQGWDNIAPLAGRPGPYGTGDSLGNLMPSLELLKGNASLPYYFYQLYINAQVMGNQGSFTPVRCVKNMD